MANPTDDTRRGRITLIGCTSAAPIAARLAEALGVALLPIEDHLFPDGERHVQVPSAVEESEAVIVASTCAPIGENLFELRLIADACRHMGARRVIGVIPYFGCARQDRRSHRGEALGMQVAADVVAGAGFARLVLVDLHAPASEGCFSFPVDHLSAVELLAAVLSAHVAQPSVVVAPDFGAIKLAQHYGRLLGLPVAVTEKTRLSARAVATGELLGDVKERQPIIVDDIVSTGATIAGCLEALAAGGCRQPALIAATHGLFVPGVAARLAPFSVGRILTTDSVPESEELRGRVERVSLAPLLATAITSIVRSWR